jgi:hypothetical protein
MTMTEPPSLLDPFDLSRGLAARLEKGLERLADWGVRSDGFTRGMHKALAASLLASRVTNRLQNRLLEAMNLPTRSDLLALGEKLQALEDRVIAISTAIDRRDSRGPHRPAALPSPPRTRKPPPALPQAVAAVPAARRKSRRAGT